MADIQTHLRLGSLLHNGSYRIKKVLGQGGFGITYLATDLSLDRDVAIKEFFPKEYCERDGSTSHVTLGTQSNREFIEKLKVKFLKEARNIAKFDCRGIIKIYAAFEENSTAYYVMDYIEGASLSELIKSQGPLPVAQAKEYVVKVGEALEYVHSHHINHLDVKPANIMVRRRDHQPILIDFGLSKQYDKDGNQTSTTPVGISHGYAPIEQYNVGGVKEFTPKTDLYSLAATLYYIVSGETPQNAQDVFDEGLKFPAGFPSELMSVISKAMSPAKKHRHESVREFLMQLEGVGSVSDGSTTINSGSTRLVSGGNNSGAQTQLNGSPYGGNTNPPSNVQQPKSKNNNTLLIIIGAGVLIISVLIGFLIGGKSDAEPDSESVTDEVLQADGDSQNKSANIVDAVTQVVNNNTAQQDAPDVHEATVTEDIFDDEVPCAEAEDPSYPSNSAWGQILNSPAEYRNGNEYHYYEGIYTTWNQRFLICFVTNNERPVRTVFKDLTTGKRVDMLPPNIKSNGDLVLTGYVEPSTRKGKWTMTYTGNQGYNIDGVGRTSKQTIPAPIHPTDNRFDF